MDAVREKKILEVAKFIIKNKATIAVTAKQFNLSTSTIKKYINDKDKLQAINIEIYNSVKEIQKELENIGHYVGGKNGIREPKYTEFEALEIAETMISDSLTYAEASKKFNIPTSTLYERIKAIDDDKIQEALRNLSDINKERFGQK